MKCGDGRKCDYCGAAVTARHRDARRARTWDAEDLEPLYEVDDGFLFTCAQYDASRQLTVLNDQSLRVKLAEVIDGHG